MMRRRLARAALWSSVIFALTIVFGVAMVAGMVANSGASLQRVEHSRELRQFEGELLARDGHTVLRPLRTATSRRYLGQRAVPDLLASAVVATEDRRFYSHGGVDARGIARALIVDVRARGLREGGSTITQQLVKNAYAGRQRSAGRKLREAVLAIALDARWSKRRTLAAYLDTAYFGAGAWGVRDASARYFGHRPALLTLPQAALLAGLLQSPSSNDPFVSPAGARAARLRALNAMQRDGVISSAQHDRASAAPLPGVARAPRTGSSAVINATELAPHAADAASALLVQRLGATTALGGGVRVRTTIDARLQRIATRATHRIDGTGLSTAIVMLDPRSGEVRALALGGPAARRAFDVATDGHRQPGSAFKPFTLAASYEAGNTPDTPVRSAPFHWPGTSYIVTNDDGYAGTTTIARATWHSDNSAFARLAAKVGLPKVFEIAGAAGIRTSNRQVPAAVLGGLSRGVTPLELAESYATFANHGVHAGDGDLAPALLLDARDRSGHNLDLGVSSARRHVQALPLGIADLVTQTLEGVIRQGTGTAAGIGRPAAGKTGTTDNNVDAWFAGYVPNLVTVVWVGHPEGSVPMRTENAGGPVVGGSLPAAIWHDAMAGALSGQPIHAFQLHPPTFDLAYVDSESGLLVDVWCVRAVQRRVVRGVAIARDGACPDRQRATPDAVGMRSADAIATLRAAGFLVETGDEPTVDPGSDGVVLDTEPVAGTLVDRQTTIRLLVGRLVASETDPSPTSPTGATTAPTPTETTPGTTTATATTPTTPTSPTPAPAPTPIPQP